MKKFIQIYILSFLVIFGCAKGNLDLVFQANTFFIISLLSCAQTFQPKYNPRKLTDSTADKGTLFLLTWSILFSILMTVIYSFGFNPSPHLDLDLYSITIWCVGLFGLTLRTWAFYTLGPWFTPDIQTQKNQDLIQSGPYKILMHPSYTGAILIYLSIPLLLKAYWISLFVLILLLFIFHRRIKFEEIALLDNFGENYIKFKKNRYRLIPYLF